MDIIQSTASLQKRPFDLIDTQSLTIVLFTKFWLGNFHYGSTVPDKIANLAFKSLSPPNLKKINATTLSHLNVMRLNGRTIGSLIKITE